MTKFDWVALLAIPLAYLFHYGFAGHGWEPVATFAAAGLAIVPLARGMGTATEHLAERTGPTWGGLLNATFGNAAELIIGLLALQKGLNELVIASLTGSILGNLLLVAGAATVVGGIRRERQTFNRYAAELNLGLLTLTVGAMLLPAIFHFTYHTHDSELKAHEHGLSMGTSLILLAMYAFGLLYTLYTHAHIFTPPRAEPHEGEGSGWSIGKSIIVLLIASVAIGFIAELLVGSAETMANKLGWNHIFVGVILLAIIGNAAEHATAVILARDDDLDTAMVIVYQSSLQIALFVTPLLVLASAAMVGLGFAHATHLNLIFSPMEVTAVLLSTLIVRALHYDGETNWLEGAMLLALYAILAIVFFYIPSEAPAT